REERMMRMDSSALERWLEPIAGPDPAGSDPRSHPSYQLVREEIAKLESPASGPCRWAIVEKEATTVLAQVAKDLTAASYLGGAFLQNDGLRGVVLGSQLLIELLTRFEAPHPRRTRAQS